MTEEPQRTILHEAFDGTYHRSPEEKSAHEREEALALIWCATKEQLVRAVLFPKRCGPNEARIAAAISVACDTLIATREALKVEIATKIAARKNS